MLGADRAHGNRGSGSRNAALAALERVGIADLRSADVRVLPYGLQRKVEIARALDGRSRRSSCSTSRLPGCPGRSAMRSGH